MAEDGNKGWPREKKSERGSPNALKYNNPGSVRITQLCNNLPLSLWHSDKITSAMENLKVAIESCPIGQSRKHRPQGATAIIDINVNYIVGKIFAHCRVIAFACNQFQHEFNYDNDVFFSLPHACHSRVIILFYALQVIKPHFLPLRWIGLFRCNWSF